MYCQYMGQCPIKPSVRSGTALSITLLCQPSDASICCHFNPPCSVCGPCPALSLSLCTRQLDSYAPNCC
jgi:hypothetical protein